jgi:hypothetical protein
VAKLALRHFGAVCLLLGAACSPAASPSPSPQPLAAPVLVTPGLASEASAWLADYAADYGLQAFDLEIAAPQEALRRLNAGQASLLIGALPPPHGWFATPLVDEPLAVVVSHDVSIRNLSLDQLRQLFSGQIQSWQAVGDGPIPDQPVIAPQGDDTRLAFEGAVMGGESITPNAMLAPTPQALLEIIGRQSGAIGVLPLSQAGEAAVAQLEGISPGLGIKGGYPLLLQVIAMAPQPPGPNVMAWLVWLQTRGTPTPAPAEVIPSPIPTATTP